MNRRLSIRLPEGLAEGLDAEARREGKTKSEIVRDALTTVGICVPVSTEHFTETLRRAAALRARQSKLVDTAALVREGREELFERSRRIEIDYGKARCKGHRGSPAYRVNRGFQDAG
jgi:hypothetical protein